jgi:hypothetical protein
MRVRNEAAALAEAIEDRLAEEGLALLGQAELDRPPVLFDESGRYLEDPTSNLFAPAVEPVETPAGVEPDAQGTAAPAPEAAAEADDNGATAAPGPDAG